MIVPKRSLAAVLSVLAILSTPIVYAQSFTFTTLAGSPGGAGYDDGTGAAARFANPTGVATDSGGNVYIADQFAHTIRKMTPGGAVTTLAGLAGSPGSANGTGSSARFFNPTGLAVDSNGNVYVGDTSNNTIRKITPAGVVTTLAGLAGSLGSADGTTSARFYSPRGVAVDGSGNVYVADSSNSTIRKVTPAGEVTTVAGLAGVKGSANGAAADARFQNPRAVALSGSTIYVADFNNSTIRKIASGQVTTLAGTACFDYPDDCWGLYDGPGNFAKFGFPSGIATDTAGNIYVADKNNASIRKITPQGNVTTMAGDPPYTGHTDGTGNEARFFAPEGIAVDGSGNVYVADTENNTIRKVTPARVVTTAAGLPMTRGSADGTGSAAQFSYPAGIGVDAGGNAYVADRFNNTIRKITPQGVVTTFAGLAGEIGSTDATGNAARFYRPNGVAVDSAGNVYVADTFNHTIRKITPGRVVTTFAGLPGTGGSADGTGNAARFRSPEGLATDSSDNLYVGDTGNHTIRKITPQREVSTLAGLAGEYGNATGTGSAARFDNPVGVAVDGSGNVFVGDDFNAAIRKITQPGRVVSTFAGFPPYDGSDDGTGTSALFYHPVGVATDSDGNVYVADQGNNLIRKITPARVVTTIGGAVGNNLYGNIDGTGTRARFRFPIGITSRAGNLYIADTENNSVRIGKPSLADLATVDPSSGTTSVTRQLDTSPQTATSWQWKVVRRPVDSTADFSSSTIRNPTFTPDVPGLYIFRLTASGATTSSITTVSMTATQGAFVAVPAGLTATATSTTQVTLTWSTVSGATSYDVIRSSNNTVFGAPVSVPGPAHTDAVSANTTYLYKVRAVANGVPSAYSAVDAATTVAFTNEPLTSGTPVSSAHIMQLRTAVNAMRAAAGLTAGAFGSALTPGVTISAGHITALRTALADARSTIGLPPLAFTDPTITPQTTTIKVPHVQEIRNGVK